MIYLSGQLAKQLGHATRLAVKNQKEWPEHEHDVTGNEDEAKGEHSCVQKLHGSAGKAA